MAGMLGPRHLLPALTTALLLIIPALCPRKDETPPQGPGRTVTALVLLLLSFALGYGLALRAQPAPPSPLPAWASAAMLPEGPDHGPPDAAFNRGVRVRGLVHSVERLPQQRLRLILNDVRPAEADAPPLPGGLTLTWQDPPPDIDCVGPGQTLTATLRLREVRSLQNPGVWEAEEFWRDQGVLYRAWTRGNTSAWKVQGAPSALWAARETLRAATLRLLTFDENRKRLQQAAAVLPALLFGDRSLCDPATLNLVAKASLAHSLALSGMHLGFAAALGYGAAGLLGLLMPGLFLRLPRQKAGLLLALPICLVYLWLGAAPPSLMRAALMLFFWGVLLWQNKPKVLVDGLIWALAVILLYDPLSLYDLRLQLSAVSVAGIALAAPLLDRLRLWGRKSPGAWLLWAAAALLGLSLAAQTALLPLMLDVFTGTPLWLPLNLLWLPVLALALMPLAFAGLLCTALSLAGPLFAYVFAPLAQALFYLAELPCAALLFVLQGMEALNLLVAPVALRPAWPAWVGFWLLLALVPPLVMRRSFSRATACLALLGMVLMVGPSLWAGLQSQDSRVRLQLLDVGQGQSVLISWQGIEGQEGRALIDGGGMGGTGGSFDIGRQIIAPLLTANRPPELTWVINTHADSDHLQGLLYPLAHFRVDAFAAPEGEINKPGTVRESKERILRDRGMTPQLWRAGDSITLAPGLVLQVLHPGAAKNLTPNNSALAVRLVWNGKGLALICSDQEKPGLLNLLDNAAGKDLRTDILVLPHHGSAGALEPALYKASSPRLALASCGYGNQWHFPAPAVRRALAELGIPLETTADKGQIGVTWRAGEAMRVQYARQPNYFSQAK